MILTIYGQGHAFYCLIKVSVFTVNAVENVAIKNLLRTE